MVKSEKDKSWSSLTETSWHASIKDTISPQLQEVEEPIFPPTQQRLLLLGEKGKKKIPGSFTRFPRSAAGASFFHTVCACSSATRGTSSTGKNYSLLALVSLRKREGEKGCGNTTNVETSKRASSPSCALSAAAAAAAAVLWDFELVRVGLNAATQSHWEVLRSAEREAEKVKGGMEFREGKEKDS